MRTSMFLRVILLFGVCAIYAFQCHMGGPDRLSSSSNQGPRSVSKTMDSDMPNEPGKCFAKCLIPDLYKTVVIDSIAMFTGKDSTNIMFAERIIQEYHKGTKWVKKKADKNCLSADPNDCLVWCLVEENHEQISIKYLEDTNQTDEWEFQTVTKEVLVKDGGYSEWKEVICQNKIDNRFYSNLKNALNIRGYDTDKSNDGFTSVDKGALVKFQKDNGLPIGQLDVETLEALNIFSF